MKKFHLIQLGMAALLLGALVLAAVLTLSKPQSALAQAGTPTAIPTEAPTATPEGDDDDDEGTKMPRTLTVTGSGQAYLTPDIAHITIGVHTENKAATEAVESNNTQTEKVIAALKTAGIADKDIQTVNFSIYPQQQYDPQGKPTGEILYMVDNSVNVTIRDLATIGDLLDSTVKSGANSINGIQFDVSDRTEALSGARRDAVANARAVAEELAAASGVTLGDVQTINVYGGGFPQPMPVYYAKGGADMAMEAASVPVNAGEMLLTVEVNIVYEIK